MDEKNVAVLIDGDNIAPKYARMIKDEADKCGNITIFRLYGSTTSPSVRQWVNVMPKYGITPVLQLSYANNKSIADQALTIDAMDILYSRNVDVFFLVTSDSDFTKLAYRVKESGKTIIGMGETKTPEALARACNEFRLLDVLFKAEKSSEEEEDKEEKVIPVPAEIQEAVKELPQVKIPKEKDIVRKLLEIMDVEWENLADIGNSITKRIPGFDVRNYRHKTFSSFVKSHPEAFEVKEDLGVDKMHKVVYIRKKTEIKLEEEKAAEEEKPKKKTEKKPAGEVGSSGKSEKKPVKRRKTVKKVQQK